MGPGWFNELGSWITKQLIHAYHQYGVGSRRLCRSQKGCTRLAAASDNVYQLFSRWFSPGTPASSTTKTGHHDIAEILLKVALINQKSKSIIQQIEDVLERMYNKVITSGTYYNLTLPKGVEFVRLQVIEHYTTYNTVIYISFFFFFFFFLYFFFFFFFL
jgi:hypothetical protein